MLDRNAVATHIRINLGYPTETDMPGTTVDQAITTALRKYSKFRPKKKDIEVVVPVSGLVQLNPAVHGEVVIIEADSWRRGTTSSAIDAALGYEDGTVMAYQQMRGLTNLHRMAMNDYLNQYEAEQFSQAFAREIILSGDTLEFLPSPLADVTVKLRVGINHTDLTFPSVDIDIIQDGAIAEAALALAMRRAKFPSVNVGGENLSISSVQELMKLHETFKSRFESSLGQSNVRMVR